MIERHGEFHLYRGDLFTVAGVCGGKARSCFEIVQHEIARRGAHRPLVGLITAGAKSSPQVNIVAHIARHLDLECRVHVPRGAHRNAEVAQAESVGAQLIEHFPGYNSVIVDRAARDALQRDADWLHIPFGMDTPRAITTTAENVPATLPEGIKRIVVPVGSGMSLMGLIHGMIRHGHHVPVLGVAVGANPTPRLLKYKEFHGMRAFPVSIRSATLPYHRRSPDADCNFFPGVSLDPIYEAKCVDQLSPGDLLWIVGRRNTR